MEVLLFGLVAEAAGVSSLKLNASSTDELRALLNTRVPEVNGLSYSIAVDRTVVHGDMPLTGSEEIAVLPPFAGG